MHAAAGRGREDTSSGVKPPFVSGCLRSMLAAVLLGAMGGVRVDDSWSRHVAAVDAACVALISARPSGPTGHLTAPMHLCSTALWATPSSCSPGVAQDIAWGPSLVLILESRIVTAAKVESL